MLRKLSLLLALLFVPTAIAFAEDAAPAAEKKEEKPVKGKAPKKKEDTQSSPAKCVDKKGVELTSKKNEKSCKATLGATWIPAKAGSPAAEPSIK